MSFWQDQLTMRMRGTVYKPSAIPYHVPVACKQQRRHRLTGDLICFSNPDFLFMMYNL